MTEEQKDEVSATIAAAREHQKKSDRMLVEILCVVVSILERKPPHFPTPEQLRKLAADKKGVPGALRRVITLLEKD